MEGQFFSFFTRKVFQFEVVRVHIVGIFIRRSILSLVWLRLLLIFFMKIMQYVMKNKVVTIFVFRDIFNNLWSMSSYGFDSLKHINLSMLNNLLYACICRTIYPCSWLAISGNNNNWSIISFLPPPFNHIHEFYQGVCGGWNFVAAWPAH